MRTILIVGLIVLLLVVALPAVGSTAQMDSGVTLIDSDVLAPAGTPHATVKYVEAITGVAAVPQNHGGSLNIVD